jgi:hypothetical protein
MLFEKIKGAIDVAGGMQNFDILHTDYTFGPYSAEEISSIIKRAYRSYYLSMSFAGRILEEFFKDPMAGLWIVKTLFTQACYMYTSILKDKKARCKN